MKFRTRDSNSLGILIKKIKNTITFNHEDKQNEKRDIKKSSYYRSKIHRFAH